MSKEELIEKVKSLKCKGLCQDSCGPIGISKGERQRIKDYCTRHGISFSPLPQNNAEKLLTLWIVSNGRKTPEMCPYLQDGRCSIYPVRPMICRLWGATERMPCPFGCTPELGMLTEDEARGLLPHPD